MSAAIPRDVWSPKSEKARLVELLANQKPKRASKRKAPEKSTAVAAPEPAAKSAATEIEPKAAATKIECKTADIASEQKTKMAATAPKADTEVVEPTPSRTKEPPRRTRRSPRTKKQPVSSSDSEPELLPLPKQPDKRKRTKKPAAVPAEKEEEEKREKNNGDENSEVKNPDKRRRRALPPAAKPVAKPPAAATKPPAKPAAKPTKPAKPPPKATSAPKAKRAPKKDGKMATKAGNKAPLALKTVISNPTQKTSYTLEKLLGTGGFGYIYVVSSAKDSSKAVMKVEPQDNGPLFSEMHFYQRVGRADEVAKWEKERKLPYLGIPTMHGFGIHELTSLKYRYLVIPLYKEGDLLQKFEEQERQFSPQTTLLLTIRMLEALEFLHDHEYVHADVKSANILLDGKKVYLADFGLARKFTLNGVHKDYKEEPGKAHDGTKEYTSVDAHRGVQPARRGDLQILGYCALEWAGGALPWLPSGNLNAIRAEKIKYEKDCRKLLKNALGTALTAKHEKALLTYFERSFALDYEEKPNYSNLYKALRAGLTGTDRGFVTWS